MAKLPPPSNTGNPFADQIGDDLAPTGTCVATILDIKDEFGVERQKYESTEIETVDLTCFLFGFRDKQGGEHRVASKRMRISGHEKSGLFGLLKSLLGMSPEFGRDYCELKGMRCLLTVEHVQRRDGSGVYAAISSLSPLPPGYGDDSAAPQQSASTTPTGSGAPGSAVLAPPGATQGRPPSAEIRPHRAVNPKQLTLGLEFPDDATNTNALASPSAAEEIPL
jgi:hypothetical protein